jgi:SAM-dependent methyltransferase
MYDAFADSFEAHAQHSAYNASYDRPAVLDLVGDVEGLDVLDAGCGPGFYAEALLAAGARVTAVDGSPRMVELARARVGDAATVGVADLEQPLGLPDDAFDVVVCALVVHHVHHRVPMLAELRRVLRPGGRLVLSTVHPTADWLRLGGSYFDVEIVREQWNDGWPVQFVRQPLEAWCEEFHEAGFAIDRIVEPRPVEHLRESDPGTYGELTRAPGFIAFSLRTRGGPPRDAAGLGQARSGSGAR